MGNLIGILLILIAFGTVVAVLWVVMREKHEHEEHFIPPDPEVPLGTSTEQPTIEEIVEEQIENPGEHTAEEIAQESQEAAESKEA